MLFFRQMRYRPHRQNKRSASRCVFILALRTFRNRAYRGRLPPNPCGLRPTQRKSLRFYFGVADNHGYSFLLDTKTGYRSHFLAVSGVINLS